MFIYVVYLLQPEPAATRIYETCSTSLNLPLLSYGIKCNVWGIVHLLSAGKPKLKHLVSFFFWKYRVVFRKYHPFLQKIESVQLK